MEEEGQELLLDRYDLYYRYYTGINSKKGSFVENKLLFRLQFSDFDEKLKMPGMTDGYHQDLAAFYDVLVPK